MQQAAGELPEFVRTILDRALALFKEGRYDGTEVLLAALPEDVPGRPFVLHLRGLSALHLGQKERARQFLTAAINANPADAEAHANLGVLLLETQRHPEAAAAFAAALSLDSSIAVWHFGLAKALSALGQTDLAIESCRDSCALAPGYAEAAAELGLLLSGCGEFEQANGVLRQALAHQPESADLHMALAFSLFASGDWQAAWDEYEWRAAESAGDVKASSAAAPRWQGEDLGNRTVLIQCGHSDEDTLQFARYVPMVKALGARVVLRAPARLSGLLRSLEGADAVSVPEDELPQADFRAPLLSLPRIFGTRPETVPAPVPYLAASQSGAKTWRGRLGDHPGLSIGLSWEGNPASVPGGSCPLPLAALRPLLACPNARFISLQAGLGGDEEEDHSKALASCILEPAALGASRSFDDLAAIIANLDLVICTGGAMAHLAGALGKPVWILLSNRPAWQWLGEREETPWYPQARLFRQRAFGDWNELVARVQAELWSLAGAAFSPADGDASTRPSAPVQKASPVLCDALFAEAMRHHRENDLPRSKKLFERVLSMDPRHVNTLCNLGALEIRLGDPRRAVELIEGAVALAPSLAEARAALGDALLSCGRDDEALAQYQEAIRIAPENSAAHAAYALALERLGRYEAAMQHFEMTVKINQHQPPEFYESLGRATLARGNPEGAEICFRHALALNPQRAPAHCGLGDVLLALGRRADAAASFRRALGIDAACAPAQLGLDRLQRTAASPP
ncbi:MAG TPA: tetratricopeptide repeat protein [Methylocella sp.]|nr:tetratricopeptide repeat protein [Methylocella sp.]